MKIDEARRLLLISNSTLFGSGFLDHAEDEIRDFLGPVKRIVFVPFALADRDGYAKKARERLSRLGVELDSVHEAAEKRKLVEDAPAIFIGGGNTFRLLKNLYDHDLVSLITERVSKGMLYMGSSAGSNVAAPTIRTTNDMPIVQPQSFDALNLVPFQINPHYLDPDPSSKHMGETREERLLQYLEENETPVVGLREGAMLRIERGVTTLRGSTGARIFRRDFDPLEVVPGTILDEML